MTERAASQCSASTFSTESTQFNEDDSRRSSDAFLPLTLADSLALVSYFRKLGYAITMDEAPRLQHAHSLSDPHQDSLIDELEKRPVLEEGRISPLISLPESHAIIQALRKNNQAFSYTDAAEVQSILNSSATHAEKSLAVENVHVRNSSKSSSSNCVLCREAAAGPSSSGNQLRTSPAVLTRSTPYPDEVKLKVYRLYSKLAQESSDNVMGLRGNSLEAVLGRDWSDRQKVWRLDQLWDQCGLGKLPINTNSASFKQAQPYGDILKSWMTPYQTPPTDSSSNHENSNALDAVGPSHTPAEEPRRSLPLLRLQTEDVRSNQHTTANASDDPISHFSRPQNVVAGPPQNVAGFPAGDELSPPSQPLSGHASVVQNPSQNSTGAFPNGREPVRSGPQTTYSDPYDAGFTSFRQPSARPGFQPAGFDPHHHTTSSTLRRARSQQHLPQPWAQHVASAGFIPINQSFRPRRAYFSRFGPYQHVTSTSQGHGTSQVVSAQSGDQPAYANPSEYVVFDPQEHTSVQHPSAELSPQPAFASQSASVIDLTGSDQSSQRPSPESEHDGSHPDPTDKAANVQHSPSSSQGTEAFPSFHSQPIHAHAPEPLLTRTQADEPSNPRNSPFGPQANEFRQGLDQAAKGQLTISQQVQRALTEADYMAPHPNPGGYLPTSAIRSTLPQSDRQSPGSQIQVQTQSRAETVFPPIEVPDPSPETNSKGAGTTR